MTKAIRSPALVVRAFNVEISRIQDQTSDPQTAAFRLQFWQDILKKIFVKEQVFQNIPANPIAQELFKVSSAYSLSKRHLEKLITSRRDLLQTKLFRNLEDIEKYADDSVSSIYYLLLSVANIANVHADHAASHLGKAQGLANILRSVHVANHHKTVFLPMDILMKNKVSQEMVLRGVNTDDMKNVAFEVASRANSHLEKARNISVPKLANQIFLPAIAVDSYLKKLQKNDFNVFDKQLQQTNALLPFSLYFKRVLNKY
ncbi:NADH dehydrogenase (ubiquinone) complex I, assembly factor 6 isoform X2 [Pectinophora gossypiella]|uniref:15-cis-phytoene synthase n=2 Tax=Pectinophora gossypiella TaxID=13191 RepID=A0A1E1WGT4_PECGO|nr:NADH dehydrogenase (ubiquinone) complex I, assembly factor 6 isoform X2 [Pectinophora gossypiella]XP_049870234.1 NADH dehydrogenase (ubiquinone) complex I, assembly factor 6 isoform X2 [Pectinophora gossypiella]XP_049870242.1 NADH dehydrogenase (ubiquinone) complex I, assembly factor 6 isoform X2 [Pectinophora gossypiella]XP_049870251.1 NADH dehydrogenase (ubiquinone) complex I, assembly factor 6 isoform X2 [Pectinophora gossypiella]XP_049870260.1 NADH dehydrogenase (ubiquinone) complex I, a